MCRKSKITIAEESAAGKKRPTKTSTAKLLSTVTKVLLDVLRKVVAVVRYIQHRIRDNTVQQSAKNIEGAFRFASEQVVWHYATRLEHYDLGNDMFEMFLDKTMTYSCALFEGNSRIQIRTTAVKRNAERGL